MSKIPANTTTHTWLVKADKNSGGGSFVPTGKLGVIQVGAVPNPKSWDSEEPMLAGRLFVGFNVGSRPVWTLDDLVSLVQEERLHQKQSPDASFLVQKGIYTSSITGETIREDGAQVIILNLAGQPKKVFTGEMEQLAEVICLKFKQEAVIVEIQKGGISQETFGVVPP